MADWDGGESRGEWKRRRHQAPGELDDNTLHSISAQIHAGEWRGLATRLGFSPAEISDFTSHYAYTTDQIYHMLVSWRTKHSDDASQREALSKALWEVGNTYLADELSEHSTSDEQSQDVSDLCEKEMKTHYSKRGSFVKTNPWLGEQKHTSDMYVHTQLLLLSVPQKTKNSLISLEDILLSNRSDGELIPLHIHVAVLSGLAGSGKTTLFDKIASDWAVGCPVLKKYKLVFLLKMFALEQGSDLTDAVFDQLLAEDTKVEKNALWSYIKTNPHQVLLLLDGFDELMTTSLDKSSFGSILKILNGKLCRGCTVLVGTRPSHFERLVTRDLVGEQFAHVSVMGFNKEDMREYVKKFYSDDSDQAEGLLARIQSSNLLSTLAASPMLLLLMCLLWKDHSTLPETMSRLYFKALEYIGKRKNVSKEEMSRAVIALGKVGLLGLLSQGQILSFKENDFEPSVLDMALKAGILTRERVAKVFSLHNNVQFIHKTFQEFTVALYLKDMFETNRETFQKTLYEIMSKGPLGFEYLLRFCCGDNEACTLEIMKAFQERYQEDLSLHKKVGLLVLHCYYESQCTCLPQESFIESFVTNTIAVVLLCTDDLHSYAYFLKCVANQTKDCGNAYLGNVELLQIRSPELITGTCVEDLAYAMSAMTNLHAARFIQCGMTGEDFAHVAESLADLPNLVTLVLNESNLGGTAAMWCKQLQAFKALQDLALSECSLNGQDVVFIAESLSDAPNMVRLNLFGNNLGGTAASWCKYLKQCRTLTNLILGHCSLTGQDMVHFGESLSDLPNLEMLNLPGNDLGGTAALWCEKLKDFKALQDLALFNCSLNGQDVINIMESLIPFPNALALDLSRHNLGDTAASWCQHVKQCKTLQELRLRECSLTGQDMVHVAGSLRDLPNLVGLYLTNNNLGGTAAVWCEQLKKCKALRTLNLHCCELSQKEKILIKKSLRDLKKKGLLIL
ncbi:NACHT, LRR and PYD domains-containing protein 3-like isoform X1 [Acanthaster planci]|uniref:NACHT, LRR and PYD domains-containing protein 3-like isoform X1 n=1 Tax=Acanthaster planci TaxID=133434 RepID=A0A8B7XRM2_ACAPL|nr:NACHT, LRR and PYD domains-containing protein 3-like isoform X1 [Acanthaster planci]